ncbi:MAG: glycosyltransferase family 4 protein [Solirubrobacteraceae bacterium]
MKVALVAPPYHSHETGVGRSVRELARGVTRAGGHVEVLAHLPEAVRASAARKGIHVRHFRTGGGTGYAASYAIWSHLRRHGHAYDLVHAHGYPTLPAVIAGRGFFGRLVFSPRHDGAQRSSIGQRSLSPYRQLGRTALASADLVICSSHAEAAGVARLVPAIAPRVRIVSDGIDVDAIANARPFSTERRVILSVGRSSGSGRADQAISALPALGRGYELVVADSANAGRRLQASARDLLVSDQVRILDRPSEGVLHSWLRTASVVLTLSEADSCELTLMEAACAGVPVIAADTPAHREAAQLFDDAAVRLLSSRASPLLIADEIARVSEMRMSPLSTLAVPSLKHASDQTVALYSALLDDRLTRDLTTLAGARMRARENGKEAGPRALGGAR